MFLFRLKHSPYVIRYYPKHKKSMFQYHKVDQNPRLFEFNEDGFMKLTHFCTKLQTFSNLIDVYVFLTSYSCPIPSNLENAFEIQNNLNVWVNVKRPYLHAPFLCCQSVHQVQAQAW